MAEGEFAQLKHHLEEALTQRAEWVGDHDLYAILAAAAVQQRDITALRQYALLAEETATRYGHTLYQANAHRAWGVLHLLVGEYAPAETRLNQALQIFQNLEAHWQAGRTLYDLGELARLQNNAAQAHTHFSQALALFESLGAAPDAARTRQTLGH